MVARSRERVYLAEGQPGFEPRHPTGPLCLSGLIPEPRDKSNLGAPPGVAQSQTIKRRDVVHKGPSLSLSVSSASHLGYSSCPSSNLDKSQMSTLGVADSFCSFPQGQTLASAQSSQ